MLNTYLPSSSTITQSEICDGYWHSLRGESIFLTGGTGLFGRWFIDALIEANHRLGTDIKLTVLSRNPSAFLSTAPACYQDAAISWVQGDVFNFVFPQKNYTYIMHMATTSALETFVGEDQLAKFQMLVQGTERVMQFAAACGAKKVLFTSSGVAYGAYPDAMRYVPESYQGAPDTMNPASALAQGKRAAEFICAYYAEKFNFELTVARCFSFVGAGLPLDIHYAIGNFIKDALSADVLTIKGDGSPMRSFLYLGDLVTWLLALMLKGQCGRIYNVGSDQAISILDLAYLVRDLLAPTKTVNVLGDNTHAIGNFGRNWYVPDISLARRELMLEVWTPLDTAISKTIVSSDLINSEFKRN